MIAEKIDNTNKHTKHQFTAYIGFVKNEMELVCEYTNAINIIIKYLKDTKTRIDTVANPVLYMMRHSLELGYKINLDYLIKYSKKPLKEKVISGHNLSELHNELKIQFDTIAANLNFEKDIIVEFYEYYNHTTKLINKLGATEISSFRYVHNKKGKQIFKSNEIRDIGSLKEYYDKAITMLVHTANLIAEYTDYVELIESIPTFKIGIGKVIMTFPLSQLESIINNLNDEFEQIESLKWKDKNKSQILTVLTIENKCYLTPINETLNP